jgi:hypothetical protein
MKRIFTEEIWTFTTKEKSERHIRAMFNKGYSVKAIGYSEDNTLFIVEYILGEPPIFDNVHYIKI